MAGRRTFFFEGLGVSGGIAIGPAYVIESSHMDTEGYDVEEDNLTREVERFDRALALAHEEIKGLRKAVEEKIDHQQAAIFDAHQLMLEDPAITDTTRHKIRTEGRNAESVLWEVVQDLSNQMKALGDVYFAERNHDLYDVGRRVIKYLARLNAEDTPVVGLDGAIIVARDLGPAETAQLSRDHVLGFCIDQGGPTSHTTIMSKALGIPAIVGVENIVRFIRTGDRLILDGNNGRLILNPTSQQIEHYQKKAAEYAESQKALSEVRKMPAITEDGTRIQILSNLELPEELDIVDLEGSEGVGLFRTEFLYLDRKELPSEGDHEEAYRKVFDTLKDQVVTMRTLDLGGDKVPAFKITQSVEANPFMGLRAIRLCVTRPEIMRVQLKTMIKAAAGRKLHVMIPMISGVEEFRFSKQMLQTVQKTCLDEGFEPPAELKLGAMIEIPSAAIQAHEIAAEADFLSIGTNDLVQYTLAVDRVNKSVTNLYTPTHPAVLRLIRMIVEAGQTHQKPVCVCGEMAANHHHALLLIGLGIRQLSMCPNSIGLIKRTIREVSLSLLDEVAQDALSCDTPARVDALLKQRFCHLENIHSQSEVPRL